MRRLGGLISGDQRFDTMHIGILSTIAVQRAEICISLICIGMMFGLPEILLHKVPYLINRVCGFSNIKTRCIGSRQHHKGMAIGHRPPIFNALCAALPDIGAICLTVIAAQIGKTMCRPVPVMGLSGLLKRIHIIKDKAR